MNIKPRLRIAQLAPIIERVPPKKYGGTERVISALTEEMVKRGHKVTLFASGDSETNAELISAYPVALRETDMENIYDFNIWSLLNVGFAYQMQSQFDIIHDHNTQNNPISLPLAERSETPVVSTLHGNLSSEGDKPYRVYSKPYLVSISYAQRYPALDLNYIGNVYHGLPLKHYPFSRKHDGYLLFVGRVEVRNGIEEKGLHHAIDIAEALNMPLLIAAKINRDSAVDIAYFNREIKPRLSSKIRWLGEVNETQRNILMSKAYCLLHTINFNEPFGLTLIEAMACGCPVIGFKRGSIPEIIKDKETGFIVENCKEAVKIFPKVMKLNRAYCREFALDMFSAERMADDYERVYYKILRQAETEKTFPHQRATLQ